MDRNFLFPGLNNMQQFQQNFLNFAEQFKQQSQVSAEQRVQQLLNSGQMTQQQFNQLRDLANSIMGRRY